MRDKSKSIPAEKDSEEVSALLDVELCVFYLCVMCVLSHQWKLLYPQGAESNEVSLRGT